MFKAYCALNPHILDCKICIPVNLHGKQKEMKSSANMKYIHHKYLV